VLGVDPGPLTPRELFWRLHAKQRLDWALTSSVCATIANAAPRGKHKGRTFRPDDFSPYVLGSERKISFKDVLTLFKGKAVPVGGTHGRRI
jgi:hypothetical protein